MTVPKCAGTSVANWLSTLFLHEEICPAPNAGVWTYNPTEVGSYRLFQGHFDHDFIQGFDGPKIKLTILREPCSRLVSLYDFWRSYSWEYINNKLPSDNGPAIAKSTSFTEFLNASNRFVRERIDNAAARQILGGDFEKLACNRHMIIEQCLRRLETFDWIGISEHFQESMYALSNLLGVAAPNVEIWANRTYHADAPGTELVSKTEPSAAERALIMMRTDIDRAIYEYGLKAHVSKRSTSNASPERCLNSPPDSTDDGTLNPALSTERMASPDSNQRRLLWIVNHRTLMRAEVPILRSLGWEVFIPKILPDHDPGYRSAASTSEYDAALRLPPTALGILNSHSFYERSWSPTLTAILNEYFGALVTHLSYYTTPLSEAARKFRGLVVARAFGREHPRTYTEFAEMGPRKALLREIGSLGERFIFGQGYSNLADIEATELRKRAYTISVPLPEDFFQKAGIWKRSRKEALFLCPAITGRGYYSLLYKRIKDCFGDLPHLIFGRQTETIDDPSVLPFLSDEQLLELYATTPVFIYPHTEPRHLHYSPLEAMVIGAPVLYLRGSLIDILTGDVRLAGACNDVADMHTKAQRLIAGDEELAAAIRSTQGCVLDNFAPDLARQQWAAALRRTAVPAKLVNF